MNPLHSISSKPTIIQKTAPSKERGSSSLPHHCDFLLLSMHLPVFFLPDTQTSLCDPAIVINRIPEVPKLSSLSPSTLKEPTTHHFIKPHHHPKESTKQRKRIFIIDLSLCISSSLSLCFLHKLLSAHLIQQLHKDSICLLTILFTNVLRMTSLKPPHDFPTLQINLLSKDILYKKIPTVLSADSWGQPFRFLTQVPFSTRSPTLPISAIVQQS
jgi:hypothetical protein